MHIAEIQHILNKLYTRKQSRELFRLDRRAFYKAAGIREPETLLFFDELNTEQLDFFAKGLLAKRAHAVAGLLPASVILLGSNFRPFFDAFSESFLPSGIHKHHEDAIAFCRHLRSKERDPLLAAMLDFEKDQVQNFLHPILWRIRLYKFNPVEIRRKILSEKKRPKLIRSKTFLLWYKGNFRKLF